MEGLYPNIQDCKKCFVEEKRIWSVRYIHDLAEGICPKIGPSEEVYECEKTGGPILRPAA